MDFDSYQEWTKTTAKPIADKGLRLSYLFLQLASEAGEAGSEWAKAVRDDGGIISDDRLFKILRELGDVQWYIARLADELGFDLSEVVVENVTKLNDRKKRDVIGGSGDFR